jgi:hypothetical protein
MQILQEEIISSYLEEMPTGRPPRKEQSKWAAKIEIANNYTIEQLEQLEYQYQQHLKYGKE